MRSPCVRSEETSSTIIARIKSRQFVQDNFVIPVSGIYTYIVRVIVFHLSISILEVIKGYIGRFSRNRIIKQCVTEEKNT